MKIKYLFIILFTLLLISCKKEQKVIYEVESVSYRQMDKLFSSLIKDECAKLSSPLNTYINDGWKVVTSTHKEKIVMYDKGTCVGTEYVIEKTAPLFGFNNSANKLSDNTKNNSTNTSSKVESYDQMLDKKGTIANVLETSEYTYIEVTDDNNKSIWLATPKTQVSKGDVVRYPDTVPMANFESKSLKKTFDKIYFVANVQIVKR